MKSNLFFEAANLAEFKFKLDDAHGACVYLFYTKNKCNEALHFKETAIKKESELFQKYFKDVNRYIMWLTDPNEYEETRYDTKRGNLIRQIALQLMGEILLDKEKKAKVSKKKTDKKLKRGK